MSDIDESRSFERAEAFETVPVARRHDGWTAERQRRFIEMLAETGCVSEAAAAIGLTPRSAYRLRARPDAAAFGKAWDRALELASTRLTALAFERVVHGVSETLWKDGKCVAERRRPSEKLHMYLLTHFDSMRYGKLELTPYVVRNPRVVAAELLPGLLEKFEDMPPDLCPADPVQPADYDFDDPKRAPPA